MNLRVFVPSCEMCPCLPWPRLFLATCMVLALLALPSAGTLDEACDGLRRLVAHQDIGAEAFAEAMQEFGENSAQGYIRSAGKCLGDGVDHGIDRVQDSLAALKATPMTGGVNDDVLDLLAPDFASMKEFHAMRNLDPAQLTDAQKNALKRIRDEFSTINDGEVLQRVISEDDMAKYLNGTYSQITGSFCKNADVSDLDTLAKAKETLRLDYDNSPFTSADEAWVLEFPKTSDMSVSNRYGPEFGGSNTDGYPFTRNGFTGTVEGRCVPEYRLTRTETATIPEETTMYSLTNSGKTPIKVYRNGIWVNP